MSFPYTLQKWSPDDVELFDKFIVVVGASKTGKSTIIQSLCTEHCQPREVIGNQIFQQQGCCVYSFESFLAVPPEHRGNIDYLIFCGVMSRRDIDRVYERYEHLFGCDLNTFRQIAQTIIGSYRCLVVDIGPAVRCGNEKASFYWYRASTYE